MSGDEILGVVLLVRHGDRQGFYQDPDTYTASATAITSLGALEEFELGQVLRARYLAPNATIPIVNISTNVFNQAQVTVRADAGGEGGVIYDSAVALTQGLWPATSLFNSTLANGSVVHSPLDGYQYIPIESVEPNEDVSLEGWTDCGTFNNATEAFYASPQFQAVANESAAFLNALQPYVNGRPVTLQNMWNIFDYMNVQDIHNGTFHDMLPATFLEQARALANFHEYGVFSSSSPTGAGNIGGRTILPSVLQGLTSIANSSSQVKVLVEAIAYKPFVSLFNMTNLNEQHPELTGIVDYASALAFEVRNASAPVVRLQFKNGTADFASYSFLNGTGDVPLATVLETLWPYAVNDTAAWCSACSNHVDRGCAYISPANATTTSSSSSSGGHHVSRVGAGFIGFGVTTGVFLLALAALAFLGLLTFGRRGRARSGAGSNAGLARGSGSGSQGRGSYLKEELPR